MRIHLVIISLLISSLTFANEPLVSLPFKLHRGHIYIQGQINSSRTINILFDTGASGNVISEKVAEEIGLRVSGSQTVSGANGLVQLKTSRKNSLSLGQKLEMKKQTFFLLDMTHLTDEDLPLEAIIGANILIEYVVSLNFDSNQIEIYPQSGYVPPKNFKKHEIQLDDYGIPLINGSLNTSENDTKNGPFLIDTGAALTVSFNTHFVNENSLIKQVTPNYRYESKALSNDGIEYIGRLKSFDFLDESFEGVPVRMSTVTSGVSSDKSINGLIGLTLLKRFNLIFDYSKNVMYTKKNALFDQPFWDNKSGLRLAKKNGFLRVMSVVSGSAADKAGIQVGDNIASVDGKRELKADAFDKYIFNATKVVSIALQRKGKIINVQLSPYSMI